MSAVSGIPRALRSSRSRILGQSLHETLSNNTSQDSTYICDLRWIVKKFKKWEQLLPRIQPYYAYKCNSDKRIAETLAGLGASFDCASRNEIQDVLSVGATPEQIVYANPIKQHEQLTAARDLGIDLTVIDNEAELEKIKTCHPQARILIRVATDDEHSLCRFSEKFGASMNQIPSLLKKAKALGLDVVGVSYHVGSGCYDLSTYQQALRNARLVFDIAHSKGIYMYILDIGGGFPGVDKNISGFGGGDFTIDWGAGHPKNGATFPEIAKGLNEALDIFFPSEPIRALTQGRDLHVMAEPGRYFVEGSHTLAVNIIGKRDKSEASHGLSRLEEASVAKYYVNDGLYGSFNNIIYDHAHIAPVPVKQSVVQEGPQALQRYLARVLPLFANGSHPTWQSQPSSSQSANHFTSAEAGMYRSTHPASFETTTYPHAPASDVVYPPTTHIPVENVMDTENEDEETPPPVPQSVLSTPFGRSLAYAQATKKPIHRSSIWGQTCDGFDLIMPDIHLPDLEIGDWLVFEDMGAYSIAGACPFNGFDFPRKVYIDASEEWDIDRE